MCKHIATLIAISERKDETFSTEEYVVAEDGSVWYDGTLRDCRDVCREYESINLSEFINMLMLVPKDKWFPNGLFSINRLATSLHYYEIDVELPGEKEADGKEWEIVTQLHLGKDEQGVFWVESGFGNFYFGTRKNTLSELEEYIIYMRNEYYRAFPDKHFRIVLSTSDNAWQELVDKINANNPEAV